MLESLRCWDSQLQRAANLECLHTFELESFISDKRGLTKSCTKSRQHPASGLRLSVHSHPTVQPLILFKMVSVQNKFCFLFCFALPCWTRSLGPCRCLAGAVPLSYTRKSVCFVFYFFYFKITVQCFHLVNWSLVNPRLASNSVSTGDLEPLVRPPSSEG